MTGGRPKPPRNLPDRVLTLSRDFLTHYPEARAISNRARDRCEDTMAWMEQRIEPDQMIVSCWYGKDRDEAIGALAELGKALDAWDREWRRYSPGERTLGQALNGMGVFETNEGSN